MIKTVAMFIAFLLLSSQCFAATWYVRADGGTRTQCTGQTDAAYPGSGTSQACAVNQLRWLYTDGTYGNSSWVISGGDTVIVKDGPQRVGYQGPNAGDHGGPNPGTPNAEGTPPIPSGTELNHTKILGVNYANCTSKTQIIAGYSASSIINIIGSQYIDIQCVELTDHAQCGRMGTTDQCVSSYPIDDFAYNGIHSTNSTSNIFVKDVDIHGLAGRGWFGPIGGDVRLENVKISANTAAGIDFDNGTVSTGGIFTIYNSLIEWNGCIEEYPILSTIPIYKCFDQSSGGYGDAIGTPNNDQASFDIIKSTIRYNTQDGPDLLHSSNGFMKVRQSLMYGNMGQQLKIGATSNSTIQNNLIIHNCNRLSASMSGVPAGYNSVLSNFCRAGGDGIALNWNNTGNFSIDNNTMIGYGAVFMDIYSNVSNAGTGGTKTLRNNIFYGYSNPNYNASQPPGMFCYSACNNSSNSTTENMWTSRSNNQFYSMRVGTTNTGVFPDETYTVNPLLVSVPSSMVSESIFDNIDLRLSSSSAGKDTGITIGTITEDYVGAFRPYGASYDIGAYEYGSIVVSDTTAPTTTADKAAGRYTTSQTVTLSSNETATIKYCLTAGCTPGTTYSAPFKTLQNIATQTLRYQATDTAGNVEAVKEVVLRKQRKK